MTDQQRHTLYSFRRCPYAMRARLAIYVSGQKCALREVVLRDKPAEMIALSPKATVPVLRLVDGAVIDESLEIVLWALRQNDPEGWLDPEIGDKDACLELIREIDGPFKGHLDRYKYANRYEDENSGTGVDALVHREAAMETLSGFETRLKGGNYLFGNRRSLGDMATAPFIRQFANVDRAWFDEQPCPNLQRWLGEFLVSEIFIACMEKYPQWKSDAPSVAFPT